MSGPDGIDLEITRLVQRWHQLPLDQAVSLSGQVRGLAQELVDAVGLAAGGPTAPLSDLGPATALDQLRVAVYEARAAGLDTSLRVGERLAELRQALS